MNFDDYDPNFDPKPSMGILEAAGWFIIIPVLVLSFLSLAFG